MAKIDGDSLRGFRRFVGDFQHLGAVVGKLAVAAPFADILVKIGPPWPERHFTALVCAIVQVVVLMYAFEFWWQGRRASIESVRRTLKVAVLLLSFAGVSYLVAFICLTSRDPRTVIGWVYLPEVEAIVATDPGKYTPDYLLQISEGNVFTIWTATSIRFARAILLFLWIGVWTTLSIVFSAFLVLQWRRG